MDQLQYASAVVALSLPLFLFPLSPSLMPPHSYGTLRTNRKEKLRNFHLRIFCHSLFFYRIHLDCQRTNGNGGNRNSYTEFKSLIHFLSFVRSLISLFISPFELSSIHCDGTAKLADMLQKKNNTKKRHLSFLFDVRVCVCVCVCFDVYTFGSSFVVLFRLFRGNEQRTSVQKKIRVIKTVEPRKQIK